MNNGVKKFNAEDILDKFSDSRIVLLDISMLPDILSKAKVILERNTVINDYVRILEVNKKIIFQEITTKNEIALRLFNDFNEAELLLNNRIDVYEKMWDGCGCKVDYYN